MPFQRTAARVNSMNKTEREHDKQPGPIIVAEEEPL
jgi:hypothetical protein